MESKTPVIGINDSGGARIQEGVDSLAGYAEIFYVRKIKFQILIESFCREMSRLQDGFRKYQ